MRTTLKTFSIILIVLTSIGMLSGDGDGYTLLAGAILLTQAILTLVYLGQEKQ